MRQWKRNEFIEALLELSIAQRISPRINIGNEAMLEILKRHEKKEMYRRFVEYNPEIDCSLTDQDMLLIQIDGALEVGDKDLFMLLTNKFKEAEIEGSEVESR